MSGEPIQTKIPLEIRSFDGVPMANVLAVLPATKLIFRPADAFVFDLVSVVSFMLIVGSQRFDNPRLDFLALVSVSLWFVRTLIRYSNKLARYDLLVKKFLTSKISHRNSGAVKSITTEAGYQRAIRAALVHSWLVQITEDGPWKRKVLVNRGADAINRMLRDDIEVRIDIDAALNDLEDLGLIHQDVGEMITVVRDVTIIKNRLLDDWQKIFDGELNLKTLVGRRRQI